MNSNNETNKKPKHSLISDTDSSDSSEDRKKSWIESFFESPYSDWFCKIPNSYIQDSFNTYGIKTNQEYVKIALKQIIGHEESSSESFDSDSEDEIERCTELLYGSIHSRYIFTQDGLKEMFKKYKNGIFGKCPRYNCNKHNLLPIGLYDKPGIDTIKLFCPFCKEIYECDELHSKIDGAYFTKSFPHYFLLELNSCEGINDFTTGLTSDTQSCKLNKTIFD